MTTFVINVTAEHIWKGLRGLSDRCPIALAMNDAGFINCCVGLEGFCDDSKPVKLGPLPPRVTAFIDDFDAGTPVDPFTFEVTLK